MIALGTLVSFKSFLQDPLASDRSKVVPGRIVAILPEGKVVTPAQISLFYREWSAHLNKYKAPLKIPRIVVERLDGPHGRFIVFPGLTVFHRFCVITGSGG